MKFVLSALSFLVLSTGSPAYAATDVLPKLEPVRSDLAHYDLHKSDGKVHLRFTGTVANLGKGGLHVIGRRSGGGDNVGGDNVGRDNTLTAYQRIEQTGGGFREVRIGTIAYHDEHNHYHLGGVSRYRLISPDGNVVRAAPKVTFCLTDSEPVGDGQRPVYVQCTPSPNVSTVKMGISAGWADVYGKTLPGQSFDVTELMKQPKQEYTLEMTSNPLGIIHEANRDHPVTVSVKVTLGN